MSLRNREIINLIKKSKKSIDIEEVQRLIDLGANLNEPYELDEEMGGSFFCDCLEVCNNKINSLSLLKLFVKNGFNLERFGSNILSDYRFFDRERKDVFDIAKYILNTCKTKLNIEDAIEAIGIEASHRNCCLKDDYQSNLLYSLCELLERYDENKDFNDISFFENIKGQKVIDISIAGNLDEYTQDTYFVSENKDDISMKMTIKCEKDTLVIEDTNYVVIDNGAKCGEEKSPFISLLKKEIIGEKIKDIEFEHYSYEKEENHYPQGRNATIVLSNGKRIIFKTLYDNDCYAIKYAKVQKKDILSKFPNVFVEKELNIMEGESSIVMPDMTARLRIFHNCDVNWGARLSFTFINREFCGPDPIVEDKECITIDVESFEVLRPYIEKYILNFDEYDEMNPIKSETFSEMVEELKSLISDLENENFTEAYTQCVNNVCGWIEETASEGNGFDEVRLQVIDFLKAFIWYFREHKRFGATCDYRVINVVGY